MCFLIPAASQLKWHLTGDTDYQLCRVVAELHAISGALAAPLCGLTGSLLQGFQAPSWQSVLTVRQSESLENTGISMFSVPLVGSYSFYAQGFQNFQLRWLKPWKLGVFSLWDTLLSRSASCILTKLTFISSEPLHTFFFSTRVVFCAVGCRKKGLLSEYFTHLLSLEMYLSRF